jgi:tripartite-type tricarboxylate transporter receptor subunit TctC
MTKFTRREFLQLAASAASLPAGPRMATAQAYPSRPVRIMVGVPAGSSPDIQARLIGQWLSERFGQPFVIENRPTNIAAEAVVRAPADGYTLLQVAVANAWNASLYGNLNFNFIRDIAPIASISRNPGVMEVNPEVPAKTVPEFIAYARANPGKINMASSGNGGVGHIYGELFKMIARVDMLHVPYRGPQQALTDLISGRVHVMFDSVVSSIEHIRMGKLRPLAVTTAKRLETLPHLPTIGEFVPGYEASAWQGLGAPKNTPTDIIERLNVEVNAALADPRIKARLTDFGASVLVGSTAGFAKLIAEETEKWGRLIRAANLKPE